VSIELFEGEKKRFVIVSIGLFEEKKSFVTVSIGSFEEKKKNEYF
jgi:hypothetical protein